MDADDSDDVLDGDYTVERVVGHKREDGKDYFRVKWIGYDDPRDLTWEPVSHLENCSEAIERFLAEEKQKKKQARGDALQERRIPPPDFRIAEENLHIPVSEEEEKVVVHDRIDALDPMPGNQPDEGELFPTRFHDMQLPGIVFIQDDPKQNARTFPWFFDFSCFDIIETGMSGLKDFRITCVDDTVVTVVDDDSLTAEVEYNVFAVLFPDHLAAFLEGELLVSE
jgi:hypothetical protein